MRRFRLLLALAVPAALAAFDGHSISEALRKGIAAAMAPGAVVVIQQHGQIVFEEAAGFADLETRRPMRCSPSLDMEWILRVEHGGYRDRGR